MVSQESPKILEDRNKDRNEDRKIDSIVIHHSHTLGGNAGSFREYHKSRGWDHIGYHYIIGNGNGSEDGLIEKGREEKAVGAHVLGYNQNSLGICLIGDFNEASPTQKQLSSLSGLLKEIMQRYSLRREAVSVHNHYNNQTSCPGKNLSLEQVMALLDFE